MNTDEHGWKPDSLTEIVLCAAFEVANVLGTGFLEKVYERALATELETRGTRCLTQVSLPVVYKGLENGKYYADMVVEDRLVVEIKCVDRFAGEHIAQCLNYLRAPNRRIALLLNFRRARLDYKRLVL